jgi:hypothetical protein
MMYAWMKSPAALSYLLATEISRGSQCACPAIQPSLPPENDGLPFVVRGNGTLCRSNVSTSHFLPAISCVPMVQPSSDDSSASAASRLPSSRS